MFDRNAPARCRDQSLWAGRRTSGGRLRNAVIGLTFAVAPLLVAVLIPATSAGDSLSSIQSKLSTARGKLEKVRGRERVLTSNFTALNGRIRTLEHEIGGLRRRESKVERTLETKRARLVAVQARYNAEHARYIQLRAKLRRAQVVLAKRLVEIYKSDPPDFVSVVLNAD